MSTDEELEGAQCVEQVQRQRLGVLDRMAFRVHIDVERGPGSRLFSMPSRPAAIIAGLQQIRVGGAVGERSSEPPGCGDADHMGAVVAG